MAVINREFLVDFPQSSGFVQYLLPESKGSFLFVDRVTGGSESEGEAYGMRLTAYGLRYAGCRGD
jgi:hypothetical protein